MTPVDLIIQGLQRKDPTIILQGKFSSADLQRFFAEAWERVDQRQFPNGLEWNASFDEMHVEFKIDYKGAAPSTPRPNPAPTPSLKPQNQQQNPPLPEPEPEVNKPKGGIKSLLSRVFGGNNTPTPAPEPEPVPQHPRPSGNHIPLENLDAPLPDPNGSIEIIDHNDSTFIGRILIDYAPRFTIVTQNAMRVQAIIQKEFPSYVVGSEGACSIKSSGKSRGGFTQFFLDFDLGMKNEVFYDHLAKGRKNAKTTMYRLTHNGSMRPIIKAYLAYAYFQTEVHYNYEYTRTQMSMPNGNMHMAYGPLVLKNGVCEGYSWALVHMLNSANIPATICFGKIKGRGNHAWVKAEIDGNIYNIDPTIDGSPSTISIRNFLKSDAYLAKQGYEESNRIYVASDTHYDDNHFVKEVIEKCRDEAIRSGADRGILSTYITVGG